jgi:hypothetical protein
MNKVTLQGLLKLLGVARRDKNRVCDAKQQEKQGTSP